MRETFASHGSSLSKDAPVGGTPLLDGNRCILRTYRNPCEQLDNTGVRPIWAVLLWQQLRDAPSDGRRLSFAFPGRKWFHMLSCHSRPDRRGLSGALHTGVGFFGLLNAVSASRPCGWGGHERRGPEIQRFHVLHSIRDGFRSALYTGSLVSARRATLDSPDSTACRFWLQP